MAGRRAPLSRAPVEAIRVPRMGALGHRRPVVRAADGELRADAPADEADRVLQRKAWLDLRPCVEAAIARRLQAVHRAAGLETAQIRSDSGPAELHPPRACPGRCRISAASARAPRGRPCPAARRAPSALARSCPA